MKRREFLKSLTTGSLGLMLGNGLSIQLAHAAGPIDPYRKFVFVYFSGAWDVLLGLDPRNPEIFTEERIEETGIQPAWHLVEANTFFVFLLFVPQNVGEVLRGADSAIERQVLEQKLEVLTQRLDALESVSLRDK